MPLYFDGTLKLVSNNSFVDNTTGLTVPLFRHYFSSQGKVVEVNSKEDYSKYIDEDVEASLILKDFQGKKSLTLVALVPHK